MATSQTRFDAAPDLRRLGSSPRVQGLPGRLPDLAVIHDVPVLVEESLPRRTGDRRRPRRRRTPTLWTLVVCVLGGVEACLLVGGLVVLVSCAVVTAGSNIHERADVGIGMIFGSAVLAVPTTILIAERPAAPASAVSGRHRQPRRGVLRAG